MREKMKELAERCFSGEVTLPKAVIWLSGAVCLLAGIVYGLKTAPMTHGMIIGCNNGSNNGNGGGCSCGEYEESENREEQE